MFDIGDRIFYPTHGAGIIEAIEDKEFLGETRRYFVLNMLLGGLHILVPCGKMSSLGIRQVVEPETLEQVLCNIQEGEPDLSVNSTQRQRVNLSKMKTGDIFDAAEVIRDLLCIEKKKPLGTSDKMMLDNARRLLVSELALVKGIDTEAALDIFQDAINH